MPPSEYNLENFREFWENVSKYIHNLDQQLDTVDNKTSQNTQKLCEIHSNKPLNNIGQKYNWPKAIESNSSNESSEKQDGDSEINDDDSVKKKKNFRN